MGSIAEAALMALYSLVLMLALVVSSPYWIFRMLTSGRYRAGLRGRLGFVAAGVRATVSGKNVVWVHAVSVGEVLAATRLLPELEAQLNAREEGRRNGWIIVLSTTTGTGQALARQRFGADRVLWYPFDFAFAVRTCLRLLRPRMMVLMESEIWPRMLVECRRAGVPVAVVNARVSDRSYRRGVRVRAVWGPVLRRISLYLAQSDRDAERLVKMGALPGTVLATGNLKYDVRAPEQSTMAERIRAAAAGRPIAVAGSTHQAAGKDGVSEEEVVIAAWQGRVRTELGAMLVLAPRHPERFGEAERLLSGLRSVRASELAKGEQAEVGALRPEAVLLDTVGDLASVYGVATVAFVGGSLVGRGGHNPLEPAQFGVPVVMGSSWENFRDIVGRMLDANAIRIVQSGEELEAALAKMLSNGDEARVVGERGREVYRQQQGATGRTVDALVGIVAKGRRA